MPFLFVYVCDLLEKLEIPFLREVGFLPGTLREYLRKHVKHWFTQHCGRLDAFSTNAQAVLSMLRPHHQVDRIYGIESEHLELIIARSLSLSKLQFLEIQKWRSDPLERDLGFFVQQVMKDANSVTSSEKNHKMVVEDIDQILLQIASFHPESSPEVQSLASSWPAADHVSLLGDLYRSLQPREAKWLTRQILKTLGPLKFPDDLELSASSGHSNLPQCLQVSIKMNIGGSGAVRMYGPMISKGHDSSLTAPTSSSERDKMIVHPPSPLTPSLNSSITNYKPASRQLSAITSARNMFPLTPPSSSLTGTPSGGAEVGVSEGTSTNGTSSHSSTEVQKAFPLTPISPTSVSTTLKATRQKIAPPHVSHSSSNSSKGAASSKHQQPSRSALGEIAHNAAPNSQVSQPQSNPQSQSRSQSRSRHFAAGIGKCQLSTTTCQLKHCIFILSPCIAANSYITSLLRWHGSNYITSMSAIKHPSVPRRCPETGKRYLKIVLVESNATEPTSEFLKGIVKLDLKRKGKRVWLRVYDWRLLESLGKADQGNVLSHDPWVRMFIGRV